MIHTLRQQKAPLKATCIFKTAVFKVLLNPWMSGLLSFGNTSSSSPRQAPPPIFLFNNSHGEWRNACGLTWHTYQDELANPPLFPRLQKRSVFVIESSPSLPLTLSCVHRLFSFKCFTIAYFLPHTHTVMPRNNARFYQRAQETVSPSALY